MSNPHNFSILHPLPNTTLPEAELPYGTHSRSTYLDNACHKSLSDHANGLPRLRRCNPYPPWSLSKVEAWSLSKVEAWSLSGVEAWSLSKVEAWSLSGVEVITIPTL